METDKPNKLKSFFDAKAFAILGLIVMQIWGSFSDVVTTGVDAKINTQIDNRIESKIEDANTWKKVLSNTHLAEFAFDKVQEAKGEIVKEVLSADSAKIDFINAIGVGSGIRNEDVTPILIKLVEAIDNGDLIFRKDIEEIIKKEVKKATTRYVNANF